MHEASNLLSFRCIAKAKTFSRSKGLNFGLINGVCAASRWLCSQYLIKPNLPELFYSIFVFDS
jgi:hypothetical protein